MRMTAILVPTDFSETAEHATAQAVELARRHGSKIHLFHVVEPYGEPPPNMMATVRDYIDRLEKDAATALSERTEALSAMDVTVSASTAHHVAPYEAIASQAEAMSADLIVMGTHGRRGLRRMFMGSVAEKVLRHVPISVLTLNLDAPILKGKSFTRIVVPVDFSDFSRRALDAAKSWIADDGLIQVVHVIASPAYPGFYPTLPASRALIEKAREELSAWVEGSRAEIEIREGLPADQILAACREQHSELVVMGNRGLTGLEHVLLGSVTGHVVREAQLPVLVVH